MTKVFITGASGQVGGNLAEYIVKERKLGIKDPKDVICLVRSASKSPELALLGVSLFEGTLMDREKILEFFQQNKMDYVFHVAADCRPSAPYAVIFDPNVIGTENMLYAYTNSDAGVFVHTSSISVYANYLKSAPDEPINEKDEVRDWQDNDDRYAITKRHAEYLVNTYAEKNPEKTYIITRLGVVIGPGDRITLPSLVNVMKMKNLPKLINHGKDTMAVTPPQDVARAQVFLAEVGHKISGETYNVTGHPILYKWVFKYIADYYNLPTPKASIPYWVFKMSSPLLSLIRKMMPNNAFVQEALSPTALNFMGKSFKYSSEKIRKLGFEYQYSAEESIINGLIAMDPDKKLIPAQN